MEDNLMEIESIQGNTQSIIVVDKYLVLEKNANT